MRLLLQLECDGSVVPASLSSTARFTMTEGWSWGDAGSIYFVASSSDLARGAFERVCLSRQTY
ncbi:hypothetical protein HMPREF9336_04272 [Segniliparus rugosus ATCC BAA-974]|uniref:Uncharacterized protein n=2 Tax=Segniliparus rugosus TaxID=286804 RepID=U1N8D3_SEGRC|nr:hypothetical protein HMPREF9336_04272 [Segniliparus rugosus ATCC BAA-974]